MKIKRATIHDLTDAIVNQAALNLPQKKKKKKGKKK